MALPDHPPSAGPADVAALLLQLNARAARLERTLDGLTQSNDALAQRTTALESEFRELLEIMQTFVGRAAIDPTAAPRRRPAPAPWLDRRSYRAPARVAAVSLLACLGAIGVFLLFVPMQPPMEPYYSPPPRAAAPRPRSDTARRENVQAPAAPAPAPPSVPETKVSTESAAKAQPPSTTTSEPTSAAPAPAAAPPASPVGAGDAKTPVPSPQTPGRVDLLLEATEPTWISVTPVGGGKLIDRLLEPGEPAWVKLEGPARLRAGNAAGLLATVGGKPVGPIGPRGKVREVDIYADGSFKLVARAAAAAPEAP